LWDNLRDKQVTRHWGFGFAGKWAGQGVPVLRKWDTLYPG